MPGQPLYPVQGSASPPPSPVQQQQSPPPPDHDHDGPPIELIVPLSIAGLIALGILVTCVICALKKRRHAASTQRAPHVPSTQLVPPRTPQQTVNRTEGADDESNKEDIDTATALSRSEGDPNKGKVISTESSSRQNASVEISPSEGDPNEGKAIKTESPSRQDVSVDIIALERDLNKGKAINTESPARQDVSVEIMPSESIPTREPPQPVFPSSGYRVCAGCKNPIGDGRFAGGMDAVWHLQCFRCFACNKTISENEFGMHEDQPYHKSCYKDCFHPKCDVCKNFTPTNKDGLIEYKEHPFWMQTYCPSHEDDGTPTCCSCERLEPMGIKYITLDDGRKLCLDCLTSATMEPPECQDLYMDIQEFFEGLNMKVEQELLLLLVQRQALNKAVEDEKSGNHQLLSEIRGLCIFEEYIVRAILRRPTVEQGNIINLTTEPYKLVPLCEVTGILILFGLPRLHTGCIVAHEMMHAYLRLKGYQSISSQVEEGICQVLSHMWLESEMMASASGNVASTSAAARSSSSSSFLTPSSSKKGAMTEFEKKLGAFIKNEIETHPLVDYGDCFRLGIRAVKKYGLRDTLDYIKINGCFPAISDDTVPPDSA